MRREEKTWSKTFDLETERIGGQKFFDAWANVAVHLQRMDARNVKLTVQRDGKSQDIPLSTVEEPTMSKAARTNKIFVDYLRNGRGATAIVPFSPRARPNGPVSGP